MGTIYKTLRGVGAGTATITATDGTNTAEYQPTCVDDFDIVGFEFYVDGTKVNNLRTFWESHTADLYQNQYVDIECVPVTDPAGIQMPITAYSDIWLNSDIKLPNNSRGSDVTIEGFGLGPHYGLNLRIRKQGTTLDAIKFGTIMVDSFEVDVMGKSCDILSDFDRDIMRFFMEIPYTTIAPVSLVSEVTPEFPVIDGDSDTATVTVEFSPASATIDSFYWMIGRNFATMAGTITEPGVLSIEFTRVSVDDARFYIYSSANTKQSKSGYLTVEPRNE